MSKFLDEYGLARVWTNIKSYISSQTMPISYLTSSEYDALPSVQKNHGLYFVTSAPMTVGETVSWAGYDWIVVNDNGDNTVVLAMSEIYELTAFSNTNDVTSYKESVLRIRIQAFEESLTSDALEQAVNTTISGVTAKIFVPNNELISDTFSNATPYEYFEERLNRVFNFDGNHTAWWTGTTGGYSVSASGNVTRESNRLKQLGVLPFVTLIKPPETLTVYLNGQQIPL